MKTTGSKYWIDRVVQQLSNHKNILLYIHGDCTYLQWYTQFVGIINSRMGKGMRINQSITFKKPQAVLRWRFGHQGTEENPKCDLVLHLLNMDVNDHSTKTGVYIFEDKTDEI